MNSREWLLMQARMRMRNDHARRYVTAALEEARPRIAEALKAALNEDSTPTAQRADDIVRCGCIGRYSECRCERNST